MPPTSPDFVPDCAGCHVPARGEPFLARLLPGNRVVLRITAERGSLPDADVDAFRRRLAERLVEEGFTVADEGVAGAVPLAIRLRVEDDAGRTDHGTEFRAARASAEIRVGRAAVHVESRPSVRAERTTRLATVREDLIERLARRIAW